MMMTLLLWNLYSSSAFCSQNHFFSIHSFPFILSENFLQLCLFWSSSFSSRFLFELSGQFYYIFFFLLSTFSFVTLIFLLLLFLHFFTFFFSFCINFHILFGMHFLLSRRYVPFSHSPLFFLSLFTCLFIYSFFILFFSFIKICYFFCFSVFPH